MSEAFDLAQKFSSVGFPTLLVLILFGSYKGIWVWGFQLRKAETESAEWKAMALQGMRIAETSVHIAKARGPE